MWGDKQKDTYTDLRTFHNAHKASKSMTSSQIRSDVPIWRLEKLTTRVGAQDMTWYKHLSANNYHKNMI